MTYGAPYICLRDIFAMLIFSSFPVYDPFGNYVSKITLPMVMSTWGQLSFRLKPSMCVGLVSSNRNAF